MSDATTRHPQSSHRLPVLLIDGVAYGPGDVLPDEAVAAINGTLGADVVARWTRYRASSPRPVMRADGRPIVLVIGGTAYAPGDTLSPEDVLSLAAVAGEDAARRWAEALPQAIGIRRGTRAPTRPAYQRPQTVEECFVDPRDAELARLRDYLAAQRERKK